MKGSSGKKILIIDDDARNIFALSLLLKSRGYQTVSTTDATEGIEILQKNAGIGVVLMDMMMPEMDGYQAIREIRNKKAFTDIPIVAVTAQAMKGDREKCMEAGATDYLSKPVDVDALLEILTEILKDE